MKNNKLMVAMAAVIVALFIFNACKKDQTIVLPSSNSDSQISYESLKPENQKFKVDASLGGTVRGDRVMTFKFAANSFRDNSWQTVTGNVDIVLTEVVTYAEMMGTAARTEAIDGILSSAGMFNISATQNGKEVFLNSPMTAYIPVNMKTDLKEVYIFSGNALKGKSNKDSAVTWVRDSLGNRYNADSLAKVYDAIKKLEEQKRIVKFDLYTFGWCNLDQYCNNPSGFPVRAKVSGVSNIFNAEAYIKLDQGDLKGLYKLTYDPIKDEFSCPYYNLPSGWKIHVIVLVKDRNLKVYKEDRMITNDNSVSNF